VEARDVLSKFEERKVKPATKTTTNSQEKPVGKCSGAACAKCISKKEKRDLINPSLYRRTPDSSSPSYWKAVADLGAACEKLGISYVLLGGTACAALGSPRTTKDIDMIAYKSGGGEVKALLEELKGRLVEKVDKYGCPEHTMDGIEVDIFDPENWPERPQYKTFLSQPYTAKLPLTGSSIKIPQPTALLAEKKQSSQDRAGNQKGDNDKADVEFLTGYINKHGGK